MEVLTLEMMNVLTIYDVFEDAFTGYFVEFEKAPRPHIQRWLSAGVDFSLSYGVKDQGRLVAFLLHAPGEGFVMNLATGVRRDQQGKNLTGLMYERIKKELPQKGYPRGRLEVITENQRAIRAYEKSGFLKRRELLCWKGNLSLKRPGPGTHQIVPLRFTDEHRGLTSFEWAFEQREEVILRRSESLELHEFRRDGRLRAFAVWNPWKMNLVQLSGEGPGDLTGLLAAMKLQNAHVGMVNVDHDNELVNGVFRECGLVNHISQYEMETSF